MGRAWGAGLFLWQKCPNCNKRKMYYNDKTPFWAVKKFYCTHCKKWDSGSNLNQQKFR